jgi:hypothetical protein
MATFPATADDDPPASTDQRFDSILAGLTDAATCQRGRLEETDVAVRAGNYAAEYSAFEGRRGFLDLPCEIRQQIYRHAFRGAHFTFIHKGSVPDWGSVIGRDNDFESAKICLDITSTCRTVYREAVPVLAKEVRMSFLFKDFDHYYFPEGFEDTYFPQLRNLWLGVPFVGLSASMFSNLKELSFVHDLGLWDDIEGNNPNPTVGLTERHDWKGGYISAFADPLRGGRDEGFLTQWMTTVLQETAAAAAPENITDNDEDPHQKLLRTFHEIFHDSSRSFKITTTMRVKFVLHLGRRSELQVASYFIEMEIILVCRKCQDSLFCANTCRKSISTWTAVRSSRDIFLKRHPKATMVMTAGIHPCIPLMARARPT